MWTQATENIGSSRWSRGARHAHRAKSQTASAAEAAATAAKVARDRFEDADIAMLREEVADLDAPPGLTAPTTAAVLVETAKSPETATAAATEAISKTSLSIVPRRPGMAQCSFGRYCGLRLKCKFDHALDADGKPQAAPAAPAVDASKPAAPTSAVFGGTRFGGSSAPKRL